MLEVRRKRLGKLLVILFISAVGISLILFSLNSKLDLFYTPSEILSGKINSSSRIKLGGMVKANSIKRLGTSTSCLVTDFQGNEIVGRLPRNAEAKLGESMPLALELSGISIFDKENAKRL